MDNFYILHFAVHCCLALTAAAVIGQLVGGEVLLTDRSTVKMDPPEQQPLGLYTTPSRLTGGVQLRVAIVVVDVDQPTEIKPAKMRV
ncbi:hypothetical protein T4B_9087 [Trichinella pseudospiralis]|uniref:Uncharacterized protein n=2 Tax=Trichinella pseudospiralis TaxID=6337 RepID=A0A0V1FAQ8_TRIPS|nr:hypothetical protein T4A_2878 [Trichinella pseudospiralis]KRY82831.1 hypothetical protein T4D_9937 [Trichinella pseudospiralis]KRZ22117.1 hypothetical protein T4B_9087 [Trichinella pseudospiralis]KRZ34903.1 hypothetical protein T4C_5131 [Trichinella pseudospiralis]